MSMNWPQDITEMQTKYGTREWVAANKDKLIQFLNFRADFLQEELDETKRAILAEDAEEIVDGLIDLCVVAIGTLDAFGVDAHKAWNEVLVANMDKSVGVKESRPNPLGLPDLVKGEDWEPPSHKGNYGDLPNNF
mgnify:FL=1